MSNESEWWIDCEGNDTNSSGSESGDDDYDNLRGFYFSWVTMGISTISAACNAFLLTILVTYRRFRQKHKIIVALSIADLVNSIAICIQYGHKAVILGQIMDTGIVPTSTAGHCALNPASFMETIGALWPAIISLLVAAENLVLVNVSGRIRRKIKHRAPLLIGFSVLVVVAFMTIGTVAAFSHADREVGWWCPRHKYIGNNYGESIDITNFSGYVIALLLNIIAAIILKVKQRRGLGAGLHEESQKIVCHLFSTISAVILVSVPNFALHQAPTNDVTMILEYPCAWCFAVNSGLSIVVCLAFLEDFRKSIRVFRDRLMCRKTVADHVAVSRLTTNSTIGEERRRNGDIKNEEPVENKILTEPMETPVMPTTRRKSRYSISTIMSIPDLDIRAFPILAGFSRMSEESEC